MGSADSVDDNDVDVAASIASDDDDDGTGNSIEQSGGDDDDDGDVGSENTNEEDENMDDDFHQSTGSMKLSNDDDDADGRSSSDDDEDDSTDDDDDDDDDVDVIASSSDSLPQISKSWAALTTHSPCYTGGTVVFSHSPVAATATATTPLHLDGQPSPSQHFILAQRGGDVSVIEASTGLLLRTVRKGKSFQGGFDLSNDYNEKGDDDDEDDDDAADAEAITAFGLSPNNSEFIAVTRSHLVRKYSLTARVAATIGEGEESRKDTNQSKKNYTGAEDERKHPAQSVTSVTDPAKVTFSFGKSGHSLPVTKVAFHPSGIFFATGSVEGLVKVWDTRNGYATHALHPTSSTSGGSAGGSRGRYAVTCLEWRPTTTSLILAIGREDGSISIHDLLIDARDSKQASLPVAVLRDHLSAVTCVAWSSEAGGILSPASSASSRTRKHGGGLFFSSGRDSVINTWVISEEEVIESDGPKRKKKKTSSDGIDQQQQISVKISYSRMRTLPVYEQIESMALLPHKFRPVSQTIGQKEIIDKKDVILVTCGTKGVVRVWKATPGDSAGGIQNIISDFTLLLVQRDDAAFGEENGGYTSLHLTSLSTTHVTPLIVATDAEHNMTFLRMQWTTNDNALELVTDRAIVGHNGEILDLSIIPQLSNSENSDKHTVAVATNSSQVRFFGLEDANEDEIGAGVENHSALSPRGMLDGHTAIVLSIDASPCGRYLVTASKDKTMRLWHIASKRCLAVATGHTEAVGSVALSNKIGCYDVGGRTAENGAGAFAVTVSKDRTLKLWPLPGSAVLTRWAEGVNEERSLNARLSARAHEKVSALCEWLLCQQEQSSINRFVSHHLQDINIVSIAPNDSLIATGSQDKFVKLWRSTDLALHGTLKGHKRGIWDCQFSPIDRVVATASGDRTIKLWSTTDCNCIRTFQGHMAGVLRVRFLQTGLQVMMLLC